MSANAALLPCPICSHPVFASSDNLRDRLIFVSTNKILCPVCQEEVSGLDKLTIHLFSHVKLLASKYLPSETTKEIKPKSKTVNQNVTCTQNKKSRTSTVKNKQATAMSAHVKFVKIYPKLPVVSLNAVPVLDICANSVEDQPASNSVYNSIAPSIQDITSIENNTTCNICGLQFVNINILKMHRCLIHNINEAPSTSFTSYQCHICPKNFKMRGSLMVHMRVAHYGYASNKKSNEEHDINDPRSANASQVETMLSIDKNDNKQWQCDVCHKCFTTKYFLKKHKRLHTGETPYACNQCNKTFTFQQSYHKHLLYHNDEKPHVCSFCGRAFKELSTLHNHQRIHTGEKPFSCESCGKCFRQRVSYLVHRRIHTGVMPYKCTACNKSFRYKVSQRTHKCQEQPPGTVVRQAGDLVEKLKKKHSSIVAENKDTQPPAAMYANISKTTELVQSGAKLSLEDTENESFALIDTNSEDVNQCQLKPIHTDIEVNTCSQQGGDYVDTTIEELIESIPDDDKNVPSPSEIFKNLCLSSEDAYVRQEDNTLNFKELFSDFNDFLE